jgi:hypothetical protein
MLTAKERHSAGFGNDRELLFLLVVLFLSLMATNIHTPNEKTIEILMKSVRVDLFDSIRADVNIRPQKEVKKKRKK